MVFTYYRLSGLSHFCFFRIFFRISSFYLFAHVVRSDRYQIGFSAVVIGMHNICYYTVGNKAAF